jgi:hypothetical protein
LTYLTVVFTLLLPVFGAMWARSYLHAETFYRVGQGRAIMLNCVQGELALWFGPARDVGPIRYGHESSEDGYSMTAADTLAFDRTARQHWLGGFGYAESYGMMPPDLGPVRVFVLPLWTLTLFAAVFPLRILLRHVKRNQAQVEAEAACCRRCGAQLAVGETRCQACSFPAFIRRGIVA